ncbi:50S ribosomal protein L3 [Candidatus Parcubacteria bacterium]|nr:MAG: 50S ribosomal protein L3 [Candidatus Parcubacteria bacterium]
MSKFILGKKLGMTQVFDASGAVIPATLIAVAPLTVIRVKTKERDGYTAVQLGYGRRRPTRVAKAQREEWKDLGPFAVVREARGLSQGERASTIDISQFAEGDEVIVSGVSKAKGFAGVMKRHGFHGAPATHGTKHAHREPGSIGGGGGRAGGRVVKGMRMAGRMGADHVTRRGVPIVKIDAEHNIIAVKGAVPGPRGALIEIRAD